MKQDLAGCHVLLSFVDTGIQEGLIVETTSNGYKVFVRSSKTICNIDDKGQIIKNYGQLDWRKSEIK